MLALGRRQARAESDLRSLGWQALAAGQGIWDAWGDARARGLEAPAAGVTAFPSICVGGFDLTCRVTDSRYGAAPLT